MRKVFRIEKDTLLIKDEGVTNRYTLDFIYKLIKKEELKKKRLEEQKRKENQWLKYQLDLFDNN